MFALFLTVFEIWVFQMFDIESLGEGNRVQHLVANNNLYKSHTSEYNISSDAIR